MQKFEYDQIAVNKKTIIYVGGLCETVDELLLEDVFIPFGSIVNITLPKDERTQKHRAFCFIEFNDPEDAAAAIENMHDSELAGRTLTCNIADPKNTKYNSIWAKNESWLNEGPKTGDDVSIEILGSSVKQ